MVFQSSCTPHNDTCVFLGSIHLFPLFLVGPGGALVVLVLKLVVVVRKAFVDAVISMPTSFMSGTRHFQNKERLLRLYWICMFWQSNWPVYLQTCVQDPTLVANSWREGADSYSF